MKPYLVHKTWVDLDHVVAIDAEVFGSKQVMRYIGIDLSFGGGRLEVFAPPDKDRANQCLDAFIAAWKAKDSDVKDPEDQYR